MSVFRESLTYKEIATKYLTDVIKAKKGNRYRKPSYLIEKTNEQILVSEDMLASLTKQRPVNKPEMKTAFTAMKGHVRKYIKVLKSLIHGLETQTLENYASVTDLLTEHAVNEIKSFSGRAAQFITGEEDPTKLRDEVAKVSRTQGAQAAFVKIKEIGEKEEEDKRLLKQEIADRLQRVIDDDLRRQLHELTAKYATKLPTRLHGRTFDMVRSAIVPRIEPSLQKRPVLQKAKIKALHVGSSFIVFDNQVLLAFDRNVLKKAAGIKPPRRREGEESLAVSPAKAKKDKEALDAAAESIVLDAVDSINKVSSQKYTLASSKFKANPRKANIYFAWLLPVETLSILKHFSMFGEFKNVDWGFPWSRSVLDAATKNTGEDHSL